MFNAIRRYVVHKRVLSHTRPDMALILLIVALLLPSGVNAQTPKSGWWNDKPNCTGKYYRYFDFNDKLRYFMPGLKFEYIHVQPIISVEDDVYLDETDNVEYAFNFNLGKLSIHWKKKNQKRIWHYCPEQDVQAPYLNMMHAYLINRSYIDLAEHEQDNIYSGDDFLFQQCMLNFRNKNYLQAFDDCEFSWLANKNGMAAYSLGQMYQWGSLGKKDYKKAYEWYIKSASVGYPDSFQWLAWAYRFGKGTKVNLALARENYLASAQYGNIDSGLAAARMLILGQGGDVDYDLAEKLLTVAADAKDPAGMNSLGVFYAKGWSGKIEPEKAFKLVKQAADENHIRSRYNLGWFYILGIGTRQKKETGEKILRSLENYSIIKEEKFLCASDVFQPPAQIERYTYYLAPMCE